MSLPYIDLQTANSFTLWPGTEHGGPFSAQRRRNSVPQYTLPGFFFFFYKFWHVNDELEKIRQRHWKEGLKISKLANLEKFGK